MRLYCLIPLFLIREYKISTYYIVKNTNCYILAMVSLRQES